MLSIDINLLRHIADMLNHLHAGLEHGHLTVTIPDAEMVEVSRLKLLQTIATLVEGVELTVISAIMERAAREAAPIVPGLDNVIIFPGETPEA